MYTFVFLVSGCLCNGQYNWITTGTTDYQAAQPNKQKREMLCLDSPGYHGVPRTGVTKIKPVDNGWEPGEGKTDRPVVPISIIDYLMSLNKSFLL